MALFCSLSSVMFLLGKTACSAPPDWSVQEGAHVVLRFVLPVCVIRCRDAVNKPVWRELTSVACTSCLLAKGTFILLLLLSDAYGSNCSMPASRPCHCHLSHCLRQRRCSCALCPNIICCVSPFVTPLDASSCPHAVLLLQSFTVSSVIVNIIS